MRLILLNFLEYLLFGIQIVFNLCRTRVIEKP
nr:MAG TPA: hypothetical protein [Caudoviricetes sp.]